LATVAVSPAAAQDAPADPARCVRVKVAGSPMQLELVERARSGDADAFGLICRSVGNRLFAIAFAILGDRGAAEDAAQQAMIDIWRFLPRLQDAARFDAWSYRVTVNAAYAEGNRQRRWTLSTPTLRQIDGPGADHATRTAVRDELERALARLTPDHRAVLVLKHVADLPNEEIAAVLEVPIGTVRSRLHHAQGQLRAAMAAEGRAARAEGVR
jgi:RNA polymerase sigma factor (sigma-70 family)